MLWSISFLLYNIAFNDPFRKLHCTRNTVHLNLFLSFILRASLAFLRENLMVDGLGLPIDVTVGPNGTVTFNPEGTVSGHLQMSKQFTVTLLVTYVLMIACSAFTATEGTNKHSQFYNNQYLLQGILLKGAVKGAARSLTIIMFYTISVDALLLEEKDLRNT